MPPIEKFELTAFAVKLWDQHRFYIYDEDHWFELQYKGWWFDAHVYRDGFNSKILEIDIYPTKTLESGYRTTDTSKEIASIKLPYKHFSASYRSLKR